MLAVLPLLGACAGKSSQSDAAGGSGGSQAGSASGGANAGGVDTAAALGMLTQTIDAFCATARICCARDGLSMTLDACESGLGDTSAPVASVASGAATLDAEKLAACRAAYVAAATTCELDLVMRACSGVLIGLVPEGGACRSGVECAGPSTCLIRSGDVGVCYPMIPHGKAGDVCNGTCRAGDDCSKSMIRGTGPWPGPATCFEDEGLYCYQTCKPLVGLGAACSDDDQCGYLGFCAGTCQKRGTKGEACAPCVSTFSCVADKCVSPPFASDYTCTGNMFGPF